MNAYTLNFDAIAKVSDEVFNQLCVANPDLKLELTATGELVIMAPTGGETGNINFELGLEFGLWNRQKQLGKCFDSSTCFQLNNGAHYSPDVAWIEQERWDALTPADQKQFPPIAPDFVLELMSPSDRLKDARKKMAEYLDGGVKLGWLIDRERQQVEIYRTGQPVEILSKPTTLSGEDILPEFTLNLTLVWH
jgi:Uma2 family endonuclease